MTKILIFKATKNCDTVFIVQELLKTLKAVNIALAEHNSQQDYKKLDETKIDIELALEL